MRTEDAFDALLEKLVDVAADKRLLEEDRSNLRAKVHDLELAANLMKRDFHGVKADKDRVVKNYEMLKARTAPEMLAEHEREIDDIPF